MCRPRINFYIPIRIRGPKQEEDRVGNKEEVYLNSIHPELTMAMTMSFLLIECVPDVLAS